MSEASRLAVIIIGASGAGKSTLIKLVTSFPNDSGLAFLSVRKDTTRSVRDPIETFEFSFISRPLFDKRRASGHYFVFYESYREFYGVPREQFDIPVEFIPLVSVPTLCAQELRTALTPRFKVFVCALVAKLSTVSSRLEGRGDEGTLQYFAARANTATHDRGAVADIELDAEKSAEDVAAAFCTAVASKRAVL